MTFARTVNGSKCQFLADSGATFSFWDLNAAKDLGLPLQPAVLSVEVADGHNVLCQHKCQIAVQIGTYRAKIWVHLMDLGESSQVILGDDLLSQTDASLLYKSRTCVIMVGDRVHTLHQLEHQPAQEYKNVVLTSIQMDRHVRASGNFFMVHLIDDGVSPLAQPVKADWMAKMPECSAQMTTLLKEFKDVF